MINHPEGKSTWMSKRVAIFAGAKIRASFVHGLFAAICSYRRCGGMTRIILILILTIPGNVMAEQYPDNFEAVSNKYESVGYEKLNENEKLIYCIWWLEGEVNNGGFHQLFWNSAGDYTSDTLRFLSAIDAKHTAELLRKASHIAFGGEAPANRERRQEILEIDEDVKMEKLNELDDDFYKYKDDITGLVNRYLTK